MTKEQFDTWYDTLSLLTYGEITDEEVQKDIKQILQWRRNLVFISDEIPGDLFTVREYWLYLSILYDCIEYGTSPRGAWLTEEGEQVLDYLLKEQDEKHS